MTPRGAKQGSIADRARLIGEAGLQEAVIAAAHALGWAVVHFRPARTKHGWATPVAADGKGWPDLVLVRERVVFAELKSETGSPRPEQVAWMLQLQEAGQEVHVWRPSDWLSGEIDRVLQARGG